MKAKISNKTRLLYIFGALLVLILLSIFFSSCDRFRSGEKEFSVICKGGEVVNEASDCPEYQEAKKEPDPETQEPEQNASQPENQTTHVPVPESEPDTETQSVKRYNLGEISREEESKQDSKRVARGLGTNAPRLNIPNARTTRAIPRMSTGLKSAEGALMLQTGGTIDKINQILGMSIGPNGRPLINKF